MSASRCLPTLLLLATGLVHAGDADEVPDADFLEYLGMWDGNEEDWTLFEGEPFSREDSDDNGSEGQEDETRPIDPAPGGQDVDGDGR